MKGVRTRRAQRVRRPQQAENDRWLNDFLDCLFTTHIAPLVHRVSCWNLPLVDEFGPRFRISTLARRQRSVHLHTKSAGATRHKV